MRSAGADLECHRSGSSKSHRSQIATFQIFDLDPVAVGMRRAVYSNLELSARHCGWSCAGCGKGPSCSNTWPRSRQSIQPPQAGQRMKCSASSLGRAPTRLPMYFPRGTLITVGPVKGEATRRPASSRSPGYEVDPGTGRASHRNVGLAIVDGLIKPNLYLHGFRGTSIDYGSHEPPDAR
jgi:hypothetical protein